MASSLLFHSLKKKRWKFFRKLIFSQLTFSDINQYDSDKVTYSIFLRALKRLKYLPLLKLINI